MNIVGEGLPTSIGNQIRKRQEIYGSINRTTEEILYLNSRTAFVKAISSVDIENYNTGSIVNTRPELSSIISNYGGDKLARNFILFNGTSKEGGILRAGIPQELLTGADQYINDFAYGFGGLEFGARPMPGITSMQTTSQGTYGSIESTTLNIKAWNRIQFEIIDLLYLRLGYSVLVEWGNTSYFNNNGDYISENLYTLESEFLAGNLNPNSIYSRIEQYKLESNGNYDAIYGIVTNFDWTFGEDGSYDITVKLISKGDIVESLKSAVLVSEKTDIAEPAGLTLEEFNQQVRTGQLGTGTSAGVEGFYKASQESTQNKKTTSNTTTTPTTTNEKASTNPVKDSSSLGRLYYNIQQIFNSGIANSNIQWDFDYYSGVYTPPDRSDIKSFFSQTYQVPGENGENNNSTKYYIRFGTLLAFIETNLVTKEKKGDSLYPSINIDYNVNTNLCYTNNLQISTDPNVCLISTTLKSKDESQEFYFAKNASPYKKTIAKTQVGQIMNIYINFDTILDIINSNGDPKNQTSIYTLLEVICNKLSVALGGVNTFRPFIDTSNNTLKIIDETSLPNRNDILTSNTIGGKSTVNDPVIQIYGYNTTNRNSSTNQSIQGYAGFVKNFKFNSKLDPKFAQIISIGATAQGGIVGEDATAFTSLNRGLKDRIKPEIFASSGFKVDSTINIETKSTEDQFKDSLADFESYIGSIGVEKTLKNTPILNEAEIASYTSLFTNIMQYTETKTAITQKKSSGTMGFIPISVGLTLDGISGLKLLNGIKVETSYLPSNYPETMLFIISKLAHKVENNIWTTELETIMTPDNSIQSNATINGKSRRQQSRSNNNGEGFQVNPSNLDLTGDWIDIAFALISKKEGFTPTAKWDVNKYRLGYGTDKILGSDGKIRQTRQTSPFETTTIEDATTVLKFEIANTYKNRVVGSESYQITETQWSSLSDPAKAALISYVYNVGSLRKGIASAIRTNDLTLAAQRIEEGPITGGGKVYPGLVKRRKEEAALFLS
jgi:GH24 family phage-related lysozyme (muramidase)